MYRYMYLYECSSCLNGYIRILAVNGIHRCIDLYISIYLYIYICTCGLPKIWADGI